MFMSSLSLCLSLSCSSPLQYWARLAGRGASLPAQSSNWPQAAAAAGAVGEKKLPLVNKHGGVIFLEGQSKEVTKLINRID